jgi:hypothetical protein
MVAKFPATVYHFYAAGEVQHLLELDFGHLGREREVLQQALEGFPRQLHEVSLESRVV